MEEKRYDIQVNQSFLPPMDEYIKIIQRVWDTKWLTNNGSIHQTLEQKLEEELDNENIVLVANGHLGLEVALECLNVDGSVKNNKEIITSPFTFISTIHAIVRSGYKPVFCDINEEDYTIDAKKIKEYITPNTVAILGVHVYGMPCDVEGIERIAKEHDLKVIYDAAHSFGVKVRYRDISQFGDLTVFSFHATKVFNTIEGGAIAVNSGNKQAIERYKNFGIKNKEKVVSIGMNAKMNEFEAAMGLANIQYIDQNRVKRRQIVERYNEAFQEIKEIKLLKQKEDICYNYAYYPVCLREGNKWNVEEIEQRLSEKGIFIRRYFYPLTTETDCYKSIYDASYTPIAQKISKNIFTLPLYADLTEDEVTYIIKIVKKLFDK